MTDTDRHAPGTFCWADVSIPDMEAGLAFYTALFGWQAEPIEDPAAGGYGMFTVRGRTVAGFGPAGADGPPPHWTAYVASADVDATAAAATAAGGSAIAGPMDVLDAGRMLVLADPAGAMLAAWQPRGHAGFEITDDPGSFIWAELMTRDVAASAAFYAATFGWSVSGMDMSDGSTYHMWMTGDTQVAGMMGMGEGMPAEVPPHWAVYFAVEDCEASVARAVELGGSVRLPPMTMDVGTFAILVDPCGAGVSIIQMASQG